MPEVARFHATLYLPFFRRWLQVPQAGRKESERPEDPPNLYECTVCLEIVHPQCVEKTRGLGQINPDLSNSWECAKSGTGFSGMDGTVCLFFHATRTRPGE